MPGDVGKDQPNNAGNEMSDAIRDTILRIKILTLAVGVAVLCGAMASAQTVGGQPPPGTKQSIG